MAAPVDDALFADIAPHYAERARADLIERAELSDNRDDMFERVDELLTDVPHIDPAKDRRKHGDDCHRRHVDCLTNKIQDLIRE
jgi:hypothetical protein